MTQTPAGWYPDPDPTYAGVPGRLRYWDGAAWTEHTNAPAQQAAPQYYAPQYATPRSYSPIGPKTTPDGVELAGWWWRVLAQFIDGLILIPLMALATAPIIASQWDDISAWFNRVTDASQTQPSPFTRSDLPAVFDPFSGPGLALVGVGLVVSAIYTLGFLRWKQATPGKLAVGLRIRLRESPDLPWSAILLRYGFVTGLGLLGRIPLLGALFTLTSLFDDLWPLWDGKKQALHDKIAKTNVVRISRSVSAGGPAPRW